MTFIKPFRIVGVHVIPYLGVFSKTASGQIKKNISRKSGAMPVELVPEVNYRVYVFCVRLYRQQSSI